MGVCLIFTHAYIFTFEVLGAALAAYPLHVLGHMLFSYFYSMLPSSFLQKVSSRVSCSYGVWPRLWLEC